MSGSAHFEVLDTGDECKADFSMHLAEPADHVLPGKCMSVASWHVKLRIAKRSFIVTWTCFTAAISESGIIQKVKYIYYFATLNVCVFTFNQSAILYLRF